MFNVLIASLTLLALLPLQGLSQTVPSQRNAGTSALTACNRVRFFPRAGFVARMVGGKFQGSNVGPTSDFVDLAVITEAPPEGRWSERRFKNDRPYRYLRYYGPAGSYSNVAELEFCHDGQTIAGEPFGTYGSRNDSGSTYAKAFDGGTDTFFDAPLANDQYVGIALADGGAATAGLPVAGVNGRRHYHIGNSLTDTEGELTQAIAKGAGFADDFFDRQTIPGAPLRYNWEHAGGFGTPYPEAFVKDAPLDDLVMQVFLDNGDSDDPTYSAKFFDLARQRSPHVRAWIYGQWASLGSEIPATAAPPDWEMRTMLAMNEYAAHALNLQALRPGAPFRVIPGGLGLIALKHAMDDGHIPGLTHFFADTFADGLHLNGNGRYFIGLVTYACLYGRSPLGLPVTSIPGVTVSLTPAQAKLYQQVAWDIVTRFRADPAKFVGTPVPAEVDARAKVGAAPPFQDPYVRYLPANANYDYLLSTRQGGKYLLKVSIGASAAGKKLDVLVNGVTAGTLEVPVTGPKDDGDTLGDTAALPVTFQPGLNLVRLHVPVGEERPYNLNALKFTRADGSGLAHSRPMMGGFQFFSEATVAPGTPFTQGFTVNDAETAPASLVVMAASDNAALIPSADIALTRDPRNPRNFSFTVTPVAGRSGRARITFTVRNKAGLTQATSFTLSVK